LKVLLLPQHLAESDIDKTDVHFFKLLLVKVLVHFPLSD